jgi:hypothetical protein
VNPLDIHYTVAGLSSYIEDRLPPYVHVYIARPKATMDIIFTNWDLNKEYWKFTMKSDLTLEDMIALADKQLALFYEYWNSPLSKALREE